MASQNLLGVRQLFKKFTGRYDLVDKDDDSNKGADEYINYAQKFLDRRFASFKTWANRIESMAQGATKLEFTDCMSIQRVWMSNSDGRFELTKLSYQEFREEYPDLIQDMDTSIVPPVATISTDTAKPEHWAPVIDALSPEQNTPFLDSDDLEFEYDHYDLQVGDHYSYRGIVIGPALDGEYTCRVIGKFYSPTLSDDSDLSLWTVEYPMLLARTAVMFLEAAYRNSEGIKAQLLLINEEGLDINKMNTEEEALDDPTDAVMEG